EGARGRARRLLRARHRGPPLDPERPPDPALLPAMVLLAWHRPGAALRADRQGHGIARAVAARLLEGEARVRRAALSVSQRDRRGARRGRGDDSARPGPRLRTR